MARKARAPRGLDGSEPESDFIFLIRYTQKGLETLARSPRRMEATNRFVTDKLRAFCAFVATIGPYDAVSFFRGSEEQAHKFWLYLRSLGTIEAIMLKVKARTIREFGQMLDSVYRSR
jgi:uncharacterized protein with GYD domain